MRNVPKTLARISAKVTMFASMFAPWKVAASVLTPIAPTPFVRKSAPVTTHAQWCAPSATNVWTRIAPKMHARTSAKVTTSRANSNWICPTQVLNA